MTLLESQLNNDFVSQYINLRVESGELQHLVKLEIKSSMLICSGNHMKIYTKSLRMQNNFLMTNDITVSTN